MLRFARDAMFMDSAVEQFVFVFGGGETDTGRSVGTSALATRQQVA